MRVTGIEYGKHKREVITGDRPPEEASQAWRKDLDTYLRLSKGHAVGVAHGVEFGLRL